MITQDLLTEFEVSLLRSYNAAVKQKPVSTTTNFATTVASQNNFVEQFMNVFQQQRTALEQEMKRGGNRDTSKLFDNMQRMVEAKLRLFAFQKGGHLDEKLFRKAVRELKTEIRSVFYDSKL